MKIIINIVSLVAATGISLAIAGTANALPAPYSIETGGGSSQIRTIADDKHMHKEGENPHHGDKGHMHSDGENPHHGDKGHVHKDGDEKAHMGEAAHHGEEGHAHKDGEKDDDHHDHKPQK